MNDERASYFLMIALLCLSLASLPFLLNASLSSTIASSALLFGLVGFVLICLACILCTHTHTHTLCNRLNVQQCDVQKH